MIMIACLFISWLAYRFCIRDLTLIINGSNSSIWLVSEPATSLTISSKVYLHNLLFSMQSVNLAISAYSKRILMISDTLPPSLQDSMLVIMTRNEEQILSSSLLIYSVKCLMYFSGAKSSTLVL